MVSGLCRVGSHSLISPKGKQIVGGYSICPRLHSKWQEGWNPSLSDAKPGFSPLFGPGLALWGDLDQTNEPL